MPATLKIVPVKMTEEEKNKLKNDAYRHKMNVSEYLRYLIEKERKKG